MAWVAQIAVSNIINRIDKPYDYLAPANALAGMRALVPFGKGNAPRKGLILSVRQTDEQKDLKSVISLLDEAPILNEDRLRLLHFLKERYFITFYAALKCLLPPAMDFKVKRKYLYSGAKYAPEFEPLIALFKKAKEIEALPEDLQPLAKRAIRDGVLAEQVGAVRALGDLSEKMMVLAVPPDQAEQYMNELPARSQGQRDILALLLDFPSVSVKEILYMTGCGVSAVKTLEKNGMISLYYQPVARIPYKTMPKTKDDSEMELADQQRKAVDEILADCGSAQVHLLHGVTGSGKTYIYMKLVQEMLARGKSILYMVPEISLTPQTLAKFYARFGDRVAVIHSGLSMGERLDEWKKIRDASQSVVVGTRSAVFAPVQNLGLIILDEEHEASYKSESSPKYHAREIARFLSIQNQAPLVLGSATPSIESYRAAQIGKYKLHRLTKRYNQLPLPEVEMVDMRAEYQSGNMSFLSKSLKEQIEQTIENGKQVILFLNRRGAHTLVACQKCGYVLKCPNCDITMTYHSVNDRCMCHFCSYSVKMLTKCPVCGDEHIKMTGIGTQHVETELKQMFPSVKILRMDMDTVANYTAYQTMMDGFAKGEQQILLGTQMVAKGLNFPNVTLVGVLQADQSLYFEDFRAGERTFSLLTQVCGRSGRAESAGKAVVQSYCPEHEVLRFAKAQDYQSFYDYEIAFRKAIGYPPFCELAVFTVTAGSLNTAMEGAKILFSALERHAGDDGADIPMRLLRPTVPRIARVHDKYRVQLILKCKNSPKLRAIARESMAETESGGRVSVSVDLNPLSFY